MKVQEKKYWIIVASKDHVKKGIGEGIVQTCHGKASPLKRMRKGDVVIYYSGKQTLGKPEKCQEFTALGTVKDDAVYPFRMTDDFCPFRRNVDYFESKDVSIIPLINGLDFIQNKKKWGYPFRFGCFEIKKNDFELISSEMLQEEYVG